MGQAGEWCYEFLAIKGNTRGDGSELCVEIVHPQSLAPTRGPMHTADAPAPPNTGSGQRDATPWLVLFGVLLMAASGALAIAQHVPARRR